MRSPRVPLGSARNSRADNRIAWVDYAKGWSIVLVVTMHSALGVGLAVGEQGWLHEVVAFAKPFRMPDFFLVAGLFAGRAIEGPWRAFVDRKVLHFVYFYALWLFIALTVKSPELHLSTPSAFLGAYAFGFVEPFSSMWFIQLLPILYLATRWAKWLPAPVVLGLAVGAHVLAASFPEGGKFAMASTLTGWTTVDSFLLFFVYFYCGHHFRDPVFAFARWLKGHSSTAVVGLTLWAVIEELAVVRGLPEIPGATLLFGLTGALAVIAAAAILDRERRMRWLAYCGRNSLVIYLSFFLPMAAARAALIKTGWIADIGAMSTLVAAAAVAGPLMMAALVRGTMFEFLYVRPSWARLRDAAARAPRSATVANVAVSLESTNPFP
jgi:uncharacterized membrane protein YcfT